MESGGPAAHLLSMQNAAFVFPFVLVLICTAYTLFQRLDWDMPSLRFLGFVLPLAAAQNGTLDLSWHPPNKTWINDLSQVLNGTGTHGFFFNGSVLPAGTPYGTYNWCNMPHVRAQEYPKPSSEYVLKYVEV